MHQLRPLIKIYNSIFLVSLNLSLYIRYFRVVIRFRKKVGYFPNIAVPTLYHEKMFWRKIFDRNPIFKVFCDKLATKDYIKEKCPNLKIPRTVWKETNLAMALQHSIQSHLVIKANHGCNFNYFTNSPNSLNLEGYTKLLNKWFSKTYGLKNLEWAYTQVKKTIFAEELIACDLPIGLVEINVRCTDGQVILCSIILNNKSKDMKVGYFDLHGNRIVDDVESSKLGLLDQDFTVPEVFYKAINYAEILSKGVDYARYDFMYNGKDIFAGEITVYPAAGLSRFNKDNKHSFDAIVTNYWDIRKSWFLNNTQSGWRKYYSKLLISSQ